MRRGKLAVDLGQRSGKPESVGLVIAIDLRRRPWRGRRTRQSALPIGTMTWTHARGLEEARRGAEHAVSLHGMGHSRRAREARLGGTFPRNAVDDYDSYRRV